MCAAGLFLRFGMPGWLETASCDRTERSAVRNVARLIFLLLVCPVALMVVEGGAGDGNDEAEDSIPKLTATLEQLQAQTSSALVDNTTAIDSELMERFGIDMTLLRKPPQENHKKKEETPKLERKTGLVPGTTGLTMMPQGSKQDDVEWLCYSCFEDDTVEMVAAKLQVDPTEMLRLNKQRYRHLTLRSKLMEHTLIALPYTPPATARAQVPRQHKPTGSTKQRGSSGSSRTKRKANGTPGRKVSTKRRGNHSHTRGKSAPRPRQATPASSTSSSTVCSDTEESDGEDHRYYETEEDDSVRAIANTYDVPLQTLLQANRKAFPGLRANSKFKKGTFVIVPTCEPDEDTGNAASDVAVVHDTSHTAVDKDTVVVADEDQNDSGDDDVEHVVVVS
eukprot:m.54934 g.54934  ORF g.54934 m.54934 type:complete len:393 (-) comp15531_c0_seq3:1046-2224(-)